jgi:hypothetical protein
VVIRGIPSLVFIMSLACGDSQEASTDKFDYGRQATLDALDRMQSNGAALSTALKIDFHVFAPSEQTGQAIAIEAEALGFKTKLVEDDSPDSWTVWCTREIVPSEPLITKIEADLDAVARPHGGYIDGWGWWSG